MQEKKGNDIPVFDLDSYSPEKVVDRVMDVGIKKARLPLMKTFILGLLGGAYISLGTLYQVVVMANPDIDPSMSAVFSPLFYVMGYILAFITGTEIFTSNNLTVMSYASGWIRLWELIRNWAIVLVSNILGSVFLAVMFFYSGQTQMFDGLLAENLLNLTSNRLNFNLMEMFFLGVFGNIMICAGVWLAMAGRSLTDKFFALILPISAVPAIGFQHVVGNMFHASLSIMILHDYPGVELATEITIGKLLISMAMISIGNIFGGAVLIGLTYYLIYLRGKI